MGAIGRETPKESAARWRPHRSLLRICGSLRLAPRPTRRTSSTRGRTWHRAACAAQHASRITQRSKACAALLGDRSARGASHAALPRPRCCSAHYPTALRDHSMRPPGLLRTSGPVPLSTHRFRGRYTAGAIGAYSAVLHCSGALPLRVARVAVLGSTLRDYAQYSPLPSGTKHCTAAERYRCG